MLMQLFIELLYQIEILRIRIEEVLNPALDFKYVRNRFATHER